MAGGAPDLFYAGLSALCFKGGRARPMRDIWALPTKRSVYILSCQLPAFFPAGGVQAAAIQRPAGPGYKEHNGLAPQWVQWLLRPVHLAGQQHPDQPGPDLIRARLIRCYVPIGAAG